MQVFPEYFQLQFILSTTLDSRTSDEEDLRDRLAEANAGRRTYKSVFYYWIIDRKQSKYELCENREF